MKWRTETPAARPYHVLESGPVRMSVGDAEGNLAQRWQYFTLTLGCHTPRPQEWCVKTWPRVAIMEARAALDEFEARLSEMEG